MHVLRDALEWPAQQALSDSSDELLERRIEEGNKWNRKELFDLDNCLDPEIPLDWRVLLDSEDTLGPQDLLDPKISDLSWDDDQPRSHL